MRYTLHFSGRPIGAIGLNRPLRHAVEASDVSAAIHSLYDRWEHIAPHKIDMDIPLAIEGYAESVILTAWIGGSYLDAVGDGWVCTLYVPIGDRRFPGRAGTDRAARPRRDSARRGVRGRDRRGGASDPG